MPETNKTTADRNPTAAGHAMDTMTFTPPASLLEALTGGGVRWDLRPDSFHNEARTPAPERPVREEPETGKPGDELRCSKCDADMTRVNMVRHGMDLVFESCSPCGTRQWTRDGLVVDFDQLREDMATTAMQERAGDA